MGIPAGIAGAFIHRLTRIPHVIWYHGADIHANRPEGAGKLQQLLLQAVGRFTSLHCFVSKSMAAMASTYNLRGPSGIIPVMPSAVAGARLSVVRKPLEFLFLGRMEEVKNPLLLAEAASLLIDNPCSTQLRIRFVGSGVLLNRLKASTTELCKCGMVELVDAIPKERVPLFLEQAYALVIPSRCEGYPVTVIEAALHGVPAIGADTVGIRDAIEHEKNGLLFKANDAKALADSITRMAKDEKLRTTLGENARAKALCFTPAASADAFLRLIGQYAAL